jgi:two-component system, NtrC family, nitrogen regulation response regulator NtrX
MAGETAPTATAAPTVLVVDDEKNIRHAIELALHDAGMQAVLAHDAAAAWRVLEERIIDAMILDIKLGDVDGIAFFRRLQAEGTAVPTIFISGHATLTEAATAVKLGAFDFLEKPFTAEKITVTAQRCLELARLKERLRLAEQQRRGSLEIIGDSAAMRRVIELSLKAAPSEATVLISGESGTGKELVANAIHAHSRRSEAPLVKVNSSAIPETLLESELFGHERGAFTGASGPKRGMFEIAHRGTLFLDEVGDLSLAAQAKILRALQSGEIQKVGSERSLKVDVRVIAASHKDLRAQVAAGGFREDLLYRLNVVPIHVPPLRERTQDISLLAHHFARSACERNNLREKPIDDEVLVALQAYAWPGNVRELQNVMERMMILSGDRITTDDLPDTVIASSEASSAPSALREVRDRAEREFVLQVLRKSRGNISRAAVELGIGRTYLHRRLAALGISKKDWLG